MKRSTEVSAEPPVAATTVASDQPSRAPLVGYAFAAIGAVLFSTKAIIIKLAYADGINAETLLALRMLLSLPFYAAIGLISVAERRRIGRPLPAQRPVVYAALVGMLGYWFASYTDFLGLVYISAQFERLILFTYPAFVVVLGALFFAQPIRATNADRDRDQLRGPGADLRHQIVDGRSAPMLRLARRLCSPRRSPSRSISFSPKD